MKNILVIAAHPDDEILGLGGTMKKYSLDGNQVYCVIMGEGMTSRTTKREDSDINKLMSLHEDTLKSAAIIGYKEVFFENLPDNRFDSVDQLDIIKIVEKYVGEIKPEIIYTHHYGDLNVDHQKCFDAVITACRPLDVGSVAEIYCFETPSSTEWNFKYGETSFKPNVFVNISETIEYKLEAMACYKSEIREYPHPRSLKALKVIAERWGTVVGRNYVEAFELVRKVD